MTPLAQALVVLFTPSPSVRLFSIEDWVDWAKRIRKQMKLFSLIEQLSCNTLTPVEIDFFCKKLQSDSSNTNLK